MAKSRKKKYNKKKKNPNRVPQAQKAQKARSGVASSGGATSGANKSDPARQRQMWIALAVAVGVFLLLLLIARLSNRNNAVTEPDAESVISGDVTSGDADAESVTSGDAEAAESVTSGDAESADSGDSASATATNATSNDASDAQSVTSGDAQPVASGDSASVTSGDAESATEYADIVVKDYGTITVALDGATAPITVQNFVSLAKSGFYDGLTFHRIMDGFMIQGGDPKGDGTGGAESNIVGEFQSNGIANSISHTRGTISMARASGDENSASSQFFIVQKDSLFLDGDYAAFGHVTSGMEVVDKICADAKPTDNNGTIKPEEQPVIEKITIRDN